MNRKLALATGALLFGAGIAYAQQQDFSKITFKPEKVAGNVTEIEAEGGFGGGNVAVLDGADGMLMVDASFAPLSEKLQASLKKVDTKGKLKWIVNTHYHGDHTGGNPNMGKLAPIIASTNVRKRLEEGTEMKAFKMTTPPMKAPGLPTITFDAQTTVWFDGEEVRIEKRPNAHTDGDSFVWFMGSKVLHTGDDFTNGLFPFVDFEHGGSVQGYLDNADYILSKIDDSWKVIPGHGPVGTKKDVEAYRKMLDVSISTVKEKLARGEKLEQIQSEGLPAEFKSYAQGGFIDEKTWLGVVAGSLQANAK